MSIRKLNPVKKKILKFFTASFHNTKKTEGLAALSQKSSIKVLITRPNHRLGNQLLLTPLIQEISMLYPTANIHLMLNGTLSSILFAQYPQVKKVYNLPKKPFKNIFNYLGTLFSLKKTRYDIAITGCETSNSSKLFVKLARARFKIYDSGTQTLHKPLHIAKYPIYNLKTFLQPNEDLSTYAYPPLSLQLSAAELRQGQQVLRDLVETAKPVISIFTFATGRKCHDRLWWDEFYTKLQQRFQDYCIVEVLPMENVSQLDFKAVHYYSRDLREIAAVIANTAVFIGADSGMMHLAASTTTPVLGLFNVTQQEVYGPYGGANEAIDTNTVSIEDLIDKTQQAIAYTHAQAQ